MTEGHNLPKSSSDDNSNKMPCWLKVWSLLIIIVAIVLAIWALIKPNDKWPVSLIMPLLVVGFGIPFLPYIPEWIEEMGGMGFTIKTRKAIRTVQQTLYINEVVAISPSGPWYWINEEKIPHQLEDKETAHFFASRKGIIIIESTALQMLEPIASKKLPSVVENAVPYRNGNDIFILYNGTLYYQSSVAYLYKLATLQGFDFRKKSIILDQWSPYLKDLIPDDFIKYPIR